MKYIITPIILAITMLSTTVFHFDKTSNISNWSIVDDVVMGGKSSGILNLNKEGKGVFKGSISLDNNGGFSSLRYRFNEISTRSYSKIILRIKGDGKKYQFRIKTKSSDYYAYIKYFDTSGDWETIALSLSDMTPAFRGRKLSIPNYDANSIEELSFLIGNKKVEDFELEIDSITLE